MENKALKCFMLLMIVLGLVTSLDAQTYATPELQKQEEKHIAKKNKALGIKYSKTYEADESNYSQTKLKKGELKNTYHLQKVEAIDIYGRHSMSEMEIFSNEATEEFNSKDLVADMQNMILYFIDKSDKTYYSMPVLKEGNELHSKDCEECRDNVYRIIQMLPNLLVLELDPQDEWQHFVFRYTMVK